MVRVLLDACVPQWLRTELVGVEVTTARFAGLDELSDRQLLAAIEGRYDVFVTLDRSIPHQQNLTGRSFAVVLLRVQDRTPEAFQSPIPAPMDAVSAVKPGEMRQVP